MPSPTMTTPTSEQAGAHCDTFLYSPKTPAPIEPNQTQPRASRAILPAASSEEMVLTLC
jgi:hypothetical protein